MTKVVKVVDLFRNGEYIFEVDNKPYQTFWKVIINFIIIKNTIE